MTIQESRDKLKEILDAYTYQFQPNFDEARGARWSKDDIADQIIQLLAEPTEIEGRMYVIKRVPVEWELPRVGEECPYIRLDEQARMLKAIESQMKEIE